MIRIQGNLQEGVHDWQDIDGKFEYPGDVGAARHLSNRSSFCSTCSSYDSDYSE